MYLNLMESVVYEAARLGEEIIVGHGSQMLLHEHEDKGRIPAIVGRIPGVEKVQMDVRLMPAGYD